MARRNVVRFSGPKRFFPNQLKSFPAKFYWNARFLPKKYDPYEVLSSFRLSFVSIFLLNHWIQNWLILASTKFIPAKGNSAKSHWIWRMSKSTKISSLKVITRYLRIVIHFFVIIYNVINNFRTMFSQKYLRWKIFFCFIFNYQKWFKNVYEQ